MNIFSTAPITFAQAALGGDVKISTVDGDVLYTVKPGTQTDTKIRLKGKGVPSLRNSNVRGDHYVTLVVQTPTKLNEKAKEALRAFDEACGNRPAAEEKAANGETAEQPKKKKGFMDKVKEPLRTSINKERRQAGKERRICGKSRFFFLFYERTMKIW